MALADAFNEIVSSLPDDWTDLELDLRIFDERRYVDAAVLLVTCNAQPYSKSDWHWRILVAHRFGHAAAAPAVHAALHLLDDAGIESRPLWKPMHQQPVFAGARSWLTGHADRLFATGLSLPSGSALDPGQVDEVLDTVRGFLAVQR